MIVTVTMNPAVDKTAEVDALECGGLNRLRNVVSDAGGKGINVSKMIAALGGDSMATGFVGGGSGAVIRAVLDKMGIRNDFVEVTSETRTNLKIVEKNGHVTELNEPGVRVTDQELALLLKKLEELATPETLFVFSGSIPAGMSTDIYQRCIRLVRDKGAKAFFDADGEAFRLGLEAKPYFIKPNREELQKHFNIDYKPDVPEMVRLCRLLMNQGVEQIALSLGAEGAMFLRGDSVIRIPGLRVKAHSTVGAGDSMVGALAYAADSGMDYEKGLALAVAASAGAVTTIGTKAPERAVVEELLEQVKIERL